MGYDSEKDMENSDKISTKKKHTFLKSTSGLSVDGTLKLLENYESCALSDQDKDIVRQLFEEIKTKNELLRYKFYYEKTD